MAESHGPVAVDVFSGAGGLSEGLLAAGLHVAVAIERHPHAALTHSFNHPDTSVICGDVRELTKRSIVSAVRRRTGKTTVDLVVGGPPCQGFSCAGKQDVRDPRNKLVDHFVEVVGALKPRMFLFENVPGFVKFGNGRRIEKLLDAFWRMGYHIAGVDNESPYYPIEYPIVNAAGFGVPQQRRRLILVGWRPGQLSRRFEWPTPTHGVEEDECDSVSTPARGSRPFLTIRQAIGDLTFLSGGMESHRYALRSCGSYQTIRRENTDILFNHLATKHRPDTVRMFRRIAPGKTINSVSRLLRSGKQRMIRLAPDGVASAVLALPDDYLHYSRHRIPTVRELARLQSFDDDYVFLGKRTTSDAGRKVDVPQYTQVGNAVPPLLAKAIGQSIVRSLGAPSRDLRRLTDRQRRHAWLRGSSGFHGYSLDPCATDDINLVGPNGRPLSLDCSADEPRVLDQTEPTDWTKRHTKRRTRRI